MAENSKIQWTDHTFNGWRGCTKVSPGCANCYAETLSERFGTDTFGIWGKNGTRIVASEAHWKLPKRWDKQAAQSGKPARVFALSLGDVFEGPETMRSEDYPKIEAARQRLFGIIRDTPNLRWLLLTKRTYNIKNMLGDFFSDNMWIGFSAENQRHYNTRMNEMIESGWPLPRTFVSAEPLLGEISLEGWSSQPGWMIVGGESGRGARDIEYQWVNQLRVQCRERNIPFFFKQWGSTVPAFQELPDDGDVTPIRLRNMPKERLGNLLDGKQYMEVPASLLE